MIGLLRPAFALPSLALFAAVTGASAQEGGKTLSISSAAEQVRISATMNERVEAARDLAILTSRMNRADVSEDDVALLISMLDTKDDAVRFWVAAALGNLGPSATAAVPKLQMLLPETDCLDGAVTSAAAIRGALRKIGAEVPSEAQCERKPVRR
ncbi:hypothetical protein SCH01S_14_00110 [Sphingomonas changbaiensis NBRC 104936]|uniref:HEAT repeat domain-containing protein n=1 Tax=Sphingomonas changbaiensis NBRC 104936 TaxID=1219043 RepID=A0A0E9MKL5_9SPHN|nr:hypothetical protein SCH01S_14_00110 [Sphingomonas changbaiensis NBRC 104936]